MASGARPDKGLGRQGGAGAGLGQGALVHGPLGSRLLRVRTADGAPGETTLTRADLEAALADGVAPTATVPAAQMFRWVESHRNRLAYAHDPYFAVSLSGARGLPHQIEAVYRHLLPQPRLRFVLADDPGAGKTIMAGLLLKELKLRGVVERALVVAPAPLTVQWQDELMDKFDERFEVVTSTQVRWQLGGNPWQHYPQVVTSLDFAKRDDVIGDLLRADWDLVIIDEAHKASAATYGDEVRKTRRYVLAEELAGRTERMLLLTATPHSGDPDRFVHFMSLLDPDQFSSQELVRAQLGAADSPYFLRRQKEDLVDETGAKLFVRRRVLTQPFALTPAEKRLYDAVTAYIGEYLGTPAPGAPGARGGRGNAVALARTVLQRRLASSLGAIRSSLAKLADRLAALADELERMTPAERARHLAELARRPVGDARAGDDEIDPDDADEDAEERAATEVSAAAHIEGLRAEVAALRALQAQADATMAGGDEAKLAALRSCLARAELAEVSDGRGKLLIFTEHRDTLSYLERHLGEWGYSTCTIHGGHPPPTRKAIQHQFRTAKQVCIATVAAGEGINLQFCHLMINYDLPWNPVRLEQRMGRIHRIGQSADVAVFNFCATNTVEGKLLGRRHEKLDAMRADLDDRVYDVIGELLDLNGVDFERLLRDTLANSRREQASLDQIDAMTPERLRAYERDIGLAQAKRFVDVEWVRQRDWASEERRLMPEYVEAFFLDAAAQVGLRVEPRATAGLWRADHVPAALRADDLPSVRRRGRPDSEYRKLTFHKERRERPEHEDAVLCSPGHPLFAAVADAAGRDLVAAGVPGAVAAWVDPGASEGYWLHLLTYDVIAETPGGEAETARAELVAVIDEPGGALALAPADALHNLTPAGESEVAATLDGATVRRVTNWVRAGAQAQATTAERDARLAQAEVRAGYLRQAFAAQQAAPRAALHGVLGPHLERRGPVPPPPRRGLAPHHRDRPPATRSAGRPTCAPSRSRAGRRRPATSACTAPSGTRRSASAPASGCTWSTTRWPPRPAWCGSRTRLPAGRGDRGGPGNRLPGPRCQHRGGGAMADAVAPDGHPLDGDHLGRLGGPAHPRASMAPARSMSARVKPPAECVRSLRVTVAQLMAMSGWWPAASASAPTELTKAREPAKSPQPTTRTIESPSRCHSRLASAEATEASSRSSTTVRVLHPGAGDSPGSRWPVPSPPRGDVVAGGGRGAERLARVPEGGTGPVAPGGGGGWRGP